MRAGIVEKAWQWQWSSAAVHIGRPKGAIYLEDITNIIDTPIESRKQYLDSDENEEDVKEIRKHTLLGRPLGAKAFIAKLGRKAGRILSACQEAGRRNKSRNK